MGACPVQAAFVSNRSGSWSGHLAFGIFVGFFAMGSIDLRAVGRGAVMAVIVRGRMS